MPLETQYLEIKMVGSLAQDIDPRVLVPGSWLALDDVQVDKAGSWTKRPGFAFLGYPTTVAPGGTVTPRYLEPLFPQVDGPRLQTPCAVAAVGDMLYSSWLESGDDPRPPFFATWSGGTFEWEAKDTRPPFVLTRTCEVRSSHELVAGACVTLDGVLWSAYKTSDPTTPRVYLRGTSLETGDVVQDDVYLCTLAGANEPFALVAAAGFVIAVYTALVSTLPDVFAYSQARFDPATRTIVRDDLIFAAPSALEFCLFSVCNHPTDASAYLLALCVTDGTEIRLSEQVPKTPATPTSSLIYDPGGDVYSLALCALDSGALPAGSCFLSYSVDDKTAVVGFEDPAFKQSWSETIIDDTAWVRLDNVATLNASGGEDQVHTSGVIEGSGGASLDRIWYRPASCLNGNLLQSAYFVAGSDAVPAARAFTWRGKAYLPIVVREPSGSGPSNLHGAIYHLAETNGYEPYRAPLVGTWAVNRFATFGRFGGSVLNPPALLTDEPAPSWALLAPSRAAVLQTQIDRITIEAPSDNATLLPATQAQGLAYLPGALTTAFDGQRAFEAGFLARPVSGPPGYISDSGGLEPGTYLYLFEWEHFDARGNRHTSAISPVVTVTVDGEARELTFGVLTETYTRRADASDTRDNAARLVVYRTQKDSVGPFYRLTTPTALTYGVTGEGFDPLANDASADTITFVDNASDGEMTGLGYGLYTGNLAGAIPGAIQDPGPVPPSRYLLNHKQRLFGISGDDPRTIFYSRLFVAGEAPAFPPPFVVYLSDTDEAATALAPLGDKVLVFTDNRIYYFYGEGPDDAGGGQGFSEPTLFSDAVGCIEPRSVAQTPMGVVFQASKDGLYLVGGDLQVTRISGPVEDYLRTSEVRSVHVDTARGWIVWATVEKDDGDLVRPALLVFSYWAQTWTRWLPDALTAKGTAGACLWRGQHVHAAQYLGTSPALSYGMIAYEGADFEDRTRNTFDYPSYTGAVSYVWPRVQTPWLRLAGLSGFQRARRFALAGISDGTIGLDAEIEVEVDHDEEDGTSPQTFTYDLAAITGLPNAPLEGHIARQKCRSVRFTVRLKDRGPGTGTTLTALTLELGGLRGFSKVAKTNKAAAAEGGGS